MRTEWRSCTGEAAFFFVIDSIVKADRYLGLAIVAGDAVGMRYLAADCSWDWFTWNAIDGGSGIRWRLTLGLVELTFRSIRSTAKEEVLRCALLNPDSVMST